MCRESMIVHVDKKKVFTSKCYIPIDHLLWLYSF